MPRDTATGRQHVTELFQDSAPDPKLGPGSGTMRAMVFDGVGQPLRPTACDIPVPGAGQLLLRVLVCGLCETDLRIVDGELELPDGPRILGHQIVAEVVGTGLRVGVPWLGWTCGECEACAAGHGRLCPDAKYTGCDLDGGMAEYVVADERACVPLPVDGPPEQAASLLCAALVGNPSLGLCGDAPRIGLYGVGPAIRFVDQIARSFGRKAYAFTAPPDAAPASAPVVADPWAEAWDSPWRQPVDGAVVFAPVRESVPRALASAGPGGCVVHGGVHLTGVPSVPYSAIWRERSGASHAGALGPDGQARTALAFELPVVAHVTTYALQDANEALADLRAATLPGPVVLVP